MSDRPRRTPSRRADLAAISAGRGRGARRDGRRALLIVGGGGFLGYYLVQAALALERTLRPAADPRSRSSTTTSAACRPGSTALDGDPNLTLRHARHHRAAARGHRRLSTTSSTPPRSPRRSTTASTRSRRWTPTSTGCAACSTMPARRSGRRQADRGLPVLLDAARSTATRRPSNIPTPETYRGNVSCTGPRACYDESKRYGETLCVELRPGSTACRSRSRGRSTTTGPGLKITDRRVMPDFARDILGGRDIVMLSDGSPTRTFCYIADAVVGLLQDPGARPRRARPTTSASRRRRSRWPSWPSGSPRSAAELFGYRRPGRAPAPATTRTTWSTIPNRRCPIIDKARTRARLRARRSASTRACGARCSGTATIASAEDALMKSLDHRNRLRRPGVRRLPGGQGPRRHLRRRRRGQGRRASTPGEPPIHEAGLDELLERQCRPHACAPPPICARPCSTAELTLIAVGTPFDGERDRSHATSRRVAARRSARRCATRPATTSSSSRARSCRAPPTTWCCRSSRQPRASAPGATSASA